MTQNNAASVNSLIQNINQLERRELSSKSTGEQFSLSAILTSIYNFKNIFISSEIIPPGRKNSSPHFHTIKEELAFVIEGNPTVHIGNNSYQLKPGEFVGFPVDLHEGHYFENLTKQPCHILLISSTPVADEIHYSKG